MDITPKNNASDFYRLIRESMQKKERKRRLAEIGKLGGRPRKIQKKIHKYSISLTERQNELAKAISKNYGIPLQEYLRRQIENQPLPDAERNKVLIKAVSNCNRIKNFFEAGVWESEEKEQFKIFLMNAVTELLSAIKK